MTIRLPRVMKSVLSVGAIAGTLTAVALSSAGAADPRGQTQAGAATDPAAQADQTPGNASAGEAIELSIEQAIATLKEQGYSDITEIEREGDRYCVDARDPNGKKVEVFVNVGTGEVFGRKKEDLSKDQVIERLEEQGYPEVSKIKREGDRYWVMARDAEGKKFELHVSAKSGEVVRKERESH